VWTQSYFVETVGNANEETIRKYAQEQLTELDQKKPFRTVRSVLKLGRLRPSFLSKINY